MDAKRLKFLMDVQAKIDKLENTASNDNTTIKELKDKFYKLSQSELKEKNEIDNEKINKIASDTEIIRKTLSIKGETSINFDFIKNERVRKQLVIDNLRMEDVRLNLQMPDLERFHEFCVNAFYQIEELINYYFGKKFENKGFDNCLDFIEEQFKQRNQLEKLKEKAYPLYFSKKDSYSDVSKIEINQKLTAYMFYFKFPIDQNILMNNLRKVRNESSHRCAIISTEPTLDRTLSKFVNYRDNNYDKIRSLINDISKQIYAEFLN